MFQRFVFASLIGLAIANSASAKIVIGFAELTAYTGDNPDGGGQFYNGDDGSQTSNSDGWSSQGAFFNNTYAYNEEFDIDFWNGWSYSNVVNTESSGPQNQYASYAGGGSNGLGGVATGENYAVAFPAAYIDLPVLTRVQSVDVTNTTYAALSMRDGDGFAKKFGGDSGDDPDFFRVKLTGYDGTGMGGSVTGEVTVDLADYTFEDNSQDYILDQWLNVDLTSLADARSIGIGFESSDVGDFGINTPTYAAFDNLRLSAVPEPSGLVLLSGLTGLSMFYRRRRLTKVG
jgi:hypothetical protein